MNDNMSKSKTKIFLIEELYFLVSDYKTTEKIEARCREIDELAQNSIPKDEELSSILIEVAAEHELRGFALGLKVAMELK